MPSTLCWLNKFVAHICFSLSVVLIFLHPHSKITNFYFKYLQSCQKEDFLVVGLTSMGLSDNLHYENLNDGNFDKALLTSGINS